MKVNILPIFLATALQGTAWRHRMGELFNVFYDCEPIKWIYTIILGHIVELTLGETIHIVTLLSRSTILKEIDCNIPIIAHCLHFSSNIVWASF